LDRFSLLLEPSIALVCLDVQGMSFWCRTTTTIVVAVMVLQLQCHHVVGWVMMDRRDYLGSQLVQLLLTLEVPSTSLPSSSSSSSSTLVAPNFPDARITHKLYFDVRISRQDGSFYVRDDLPDTFENRVLSARLGLGLYGAAAPAAVERFLTFALPSPTDDDVNNPLPSYSRCTFTSLDQGTGLLLGGYIPSLRLTEVGGRTALQYGSRILPAPLWIDKRGSAATTTKLSHSSKGLLTHRTLDATPSFGITTRASPSLDGTHTVFGQVLWNDETAQFLNVLQELPTYSIDRPADYDDPAGIASSVFNAQRDFFRGAAKTLGDTRVDKVYQGKLLRRMEVTRVGLI
jgi:cyclophilin family peptidyl-prolyl cis-trans isomerase